MKATIITRIAVLVGCATQQEARAAKTAVAR
jgi:hypothetical protein